MPEIREVKEKVLEAAQQFNIPVSNVLDELRRMEDRKRKIKGVWAVDGWMWIATEQDTKFTWSGVVFSPMTPRGEYGSWYIDEPKAQIIVTPEPRWKVSEEELKKHRKMRELAGFL